MRQATGLKLILTGTLALLGAAGSAGEPIGPAQGQPALAGGELILDQGIPWRFFMAGNHTPAIQTKAGVEKGDPAWAKGLVPDGWTAPEFDDRAWGMSPGPFFGPSNMNGYMNRWQEMTSGNLALLCLRGRFEVARPAEMSLSLEYRGGVVVYVNGKEVARQHLPKEAIEPGTLAEPYPREAFVDAKGKILPGEAIDLANAGYCANHLAKRVRRLAVRIPADAFRAGVNVLAVEVHRSPYDEACLIGPKKRFFGDEWGKYGWSTAGLAALELRAPGGSAISAVGRPKGFQVWNADPMAECTTWTMASAATSSARSSWWEPATEPSPVRWWSAATRPSTASRAS
jgi:hypothetical protein